MATHLLYVADSNDQHQSPVFYRFYRYFFAFPVG
jgi:hypothetical protein